MNIYAPNYYKNFKCIADKCTHSCCVDWEIIIDERSYLKYKSSENKFAKEILENIEESDGEYKFALTKSNRCPNLDKKGLCKIITNLGEDYLCDICDLHPRFFNVSHEREEAGLGFSCEEAVRVALLSKEPFELVKIGEKEDEHLIDETAYEFIEKRDFLINLFEVGNGALKEMMKKCENEFSLTDKIYTMEEWIDIFLSLEILDKEWSLILEGAKEKKEVFSVEDFEPYFKKFAQYLFYRHLAGSESELNFRSRVAFCILGLKLVLYIAQREKNLTQERIFDIIRLYSSEIEYSEDNTESLIFEFESVL